MFLYENRDNRDKKAFVLEVTDDMKYDYIISKIEECDRYVKKLNLRQSRKMFPKKTCQYCNYKTSMQKGWKVMGVSRGKDLEEEIKKAF